ncbi:MAG TPA: c-type cytochrome, partial [Gammaproteobacteria bacterium]|nr:c-type cytochrome [Gammaproteobacteria bacterium]
MCHSRHRLTGRRRRCAAACLAAAWLTAGFAITFAREAGAQAAAFFPADAARGRGLALACMACHASAEMLSGTEPAFHVPKLAGQRGEAIFSALRDYRSGTRQSAVMQPFVAALSLQDMRDVAAYLAASGPYVPGTEDAGSWAHQKVRRDCTACHGDSGMGVMAGVPVLTGQHEDYLIHALEAYRDGSRDDPTMGPIAQALAPDEIVQLSAYFAKQSHLQANAMAAPGAAIVGQPAVGASTDAPERVAATDAAIA